MAGHRYEPAGPISGAVHGFEQTFIALLLGLMTLVTFASVVVRYVFNSAVGRWFEGLLGIDLPDTILWGQEVVLILFAWLVLFGIGFCVKITAHLGVDAVINLFARPGRRVFALLAALASVAYALLLLKGAWDYWAPFAAFDRTSGRWFPTGFEQTRDQAWYITDQVPMLGVFGWLEGAINQGEEYEKLPRVIPYVILPIGVLLLVIRYVQATIGIYRGDRESLIASHEAEDAVEEAAQTAKGEG